MKDFISLPKIDAHIHYNSSREILCHLGKEYGFSFLTINTEVPFFPAVDRQQRIATDMMKRHPGFLEFIGTFSVEHWDKADWQDRAETDIAKAMDEGAHGIKIWKNIGMDLRNDDGSMIMISDTRFDPLLSQLATNGIPVIGHLGEPRNCWLPIEKMTVASDREYFSAHPEYHMYVHPDCPSYQKQIQARDAMLDKHTDLRFIGAHLASLEWSIDEVGRWLDRYPNTAVDLAERINHLQLQAVEEHPKVISFFETYQDRIIYGTDIIDDGNLNDQELTEELTGRWMDHWKFFSSGETLRSDEFSGTFRGLSLPDHILEKIYYHNAVKWYGM